MNSALALTALLVASGCSTKMDGGLSEGAAAVGQTIDGSEIRGSDSGTPTGSPEICDGEDNDGDGEIDEGVLITFYEDADGDGWGDELSTIEACELPDGAVEQASDCDDSDSDIHPGAEERCNEKDDDCDGDTDEGLSETWFEDGDGDGYGTPASAITSCEEPEGYVSNSDDCDDATSIVSPAATEVCNDMDDDCDGRVDEGVSTMYYPDNDGDGFGVLEDGVLECGHPMDYSTMPGDCDDMDDSIHPDGVEICDGKDNDCDGVIDNHVVEGTFTYYVDLDGDGHAAIPTDEGLEAYTGCSIPDGYSAVADDCDDTDASLSPTAPEVCNGRDDNCNGSIDEGVLLTFYRDLDLDGYGTTAVFACTAPDYTATSDGDCDDSREDIYPGAPEYCDGIDQNCNVIIDEEPVDGFTWYADTDGDGYGDAATTRRTCDEPAGYVEDDTDCGPDSADTYPGAEERCDGFDNDCDGSIDEDPVDAPVWHYDGDEDGYGDPLIFVTDCEAPDGYTSSRDDCDDADPDIHPGRDEVCDDMDNDCDGSIDIDPVEGIVLYRDDDRDGFGLSDSTRTGCEATEGWSDIGGDCDDTHTGIHPDAEEICNGRDDDCDEWIDDDIAEDIGCPCNMEYYGDHAYLFCHSRQTWTDAHGICNFYGYDLVSIEDADEQTWVHDVASGLDSRNWWWIGFNDRSSEGLFEWSDGSGGTWSSASGSGTSYVNWNGGQPDDDRGREDCVHMYADGRWNDLECTRRGWGSYYTYYICEAGG